MPVCAQVPRNGFEPRTEPVRAAQFIEIFEPEQKRVLRDILRNLEVADPAVRDCQHSAAVQVDQRAVRCTVALLRFPDKFEFVCAVHCRLRYHGTPNYTTFQPFHNYRQPTMEGVTAGCDWTHALLLIRRPSGD